MCHYRLFLCRSRYLNVRPLAHISASFFSAYSMEYIQHSYSKPAAGTHSQLVNSEHDPFHGLWLLQIRRLKRGERDLFPVFTELRQWGSRMWLETILEVDNWPPRRLWGGYLDCGWMDESLLPTEDIIALQRDNTFDSQHQHQQLFQICDWGICVMRWHCYSRG